MRCHIIASTLRAKYKLPSMNFPRSTARLHHLSNGLTLILDPHHDHPVVSAQLWVATGSVHEGKHLGAGLSHFLEHMVFKGTKHYTGERLAAVVQGAGGHWNAYTSFDRTVYYIDGPATGLDIFLSVLNDMVFRPTLPESEFLLEKDVIRREIDMGLDDPHHAGMNLLLETAFRHDPRRLPVIGHRGSFDAITHQNLLDYHHQRYTTNRAFFVISGDFDCAEAIAKIETHTADLQAGPAQEPYLLEDSPLCSRLEAIRTFAVPSSRVVMAWKIPRLGHADLPAYELLSLMLGGGQSSHLYCELREKQELVLEIGTFTWSGQLGDGLLAVSAECNPEQRHAFVDAVHQQLSHYAQLDFTADLARAKRQTMVSQYRGLVSASGRASDLASNWHEARDLHFTSHYLQSLDQVTESDIRRVLATLNDQKLIITHLNPLGTEETADLALDQQTKLQGQTVQLSNGLEVALFPDSRLPMLSIQTAIRGGLTSESFAYAGLTSLLASTLNEGTKQRSAWDIAATLDRLGASLHASAGNNTLTISANGLAEDQATLLDVWADVLINPTFPDDAVERDKASQYCSILEAKEDPLTIGLLTARRLLFGDHSYGIPSMGTEESMDKLTSEALSEYHRKFFCVENMKVAIGGDFDAAEMIELLEKLLVSLPHGTAFQAPVTKCRAELSETLQREKKQAVLAIGYPGFGITDERRFANMLLMEYCSDMAGPLFTRIREALGLAYQVGAFEFLGHDVGMVNFYLSTSPEQLSLAHRELQQQLRLIAEHGIPAEVFENVRATVLSALLLQQQSTAAIAKLAAIDLLFGLPATHHRDVRDRILSLKIDDVRAVAQYLLQEDKAVTAMVTPG